MSDVIETKLDAAHLLGGADMALPASGAARRVGRFEVHDVCDVATIVLMAALVVVATCTFKDYAISNDEAVQHHYGELIISYYGSGLSDQSLFAFKNLYLYGGLFDIVAVCLSHLLPINPYDLRHIMCALIGIGGIGAAAATARLIAGPRAALITAIALSTCGVWYGPMFNHTKDIPFAAAMMGATLFLIRIARSLPSPRALDVAAFGALTGAALGMRVLGLLLIIYVGFAIALYLPRLQFDLGQTRWRFVVRSSMRLLPALLLAYAIMILAWPWAALAPLNPIRGLLEFSEFQYQIRTVLAGQVYDMADVPRLYVPVYILVRTPVLMLFGAALAILLTVLPGSVAGARRQHRRDIALIAVTLIFPVACQVALHGPAFTGMRHFLFVIPALAILAAIGLDSALTALAAYGRLAAASGLAVVTGCFISNAVTLVRLHPYEYLFYNSIVGGVEGASRRYDMDYWFGSMPEALGQLESYLRRAPPERAGRAPRIYSVAVCGERPSFEKTVTLPQLRWDFMPEWEQSDFFLAPTQMNCDRDLDGKVIGTVERLGVAIAYIKDRRALIRPSDTAAR
jgi:Dolichyl-phosphate-mannose-protein mannosyltransferase